MVGLIIKSIESDRLWRYFFGSSRLMAWGTTCWTTSPGFLSSPQVADFNGKQNPKLAVWIRNGNLACREKVRDKPKIIPLYVSPAERARENSNYSYIVFPGALGSKSENETDMTAWMEKINKSSNFDSWVVPYHECHLLNSLKFSKEIPDVPTWNKFDKTNRIVRFFRQPNATKKTRHTRIDRGWMPRKSMNLTPRICFAKRWPNGMVQTKFRIDLDKSYEKIENIWIVARPVHCFRQSAFFYNVLHKFNTCNKLHIKFLNLVDNWNIILCDRLIIIHLTLSREKCVSTPSSPDSGKCVAFFGSPCSCVWDNTCATASVDSKTKKYPGKQECNLMQFMKCLPWYFWVLAHHFMIPGTAHHVFKNRYCTHITMGAGTHWWTISSDVGAQSIANRTKSFHTLIHWTNSTSHPYVAGFFFAGNLRHPLIKLYHHIRCA